MDSNLDHQVNVVIGLFAAACLASAFFYGPFAIVIGVIGLLVVAALLGRFVADREAGANPALVSN